MGQTSYLVGIGSNRRHGRHGAPERVIAAALAAMMAQGLKVKAASPILRSAAMGPSDRRFANAAALVRTRLDPPALLACLKAIEAGFGRRPGRRWGARVLDLDILAWSEGAWPPTPRRPTPQGLAIPHRALAGRGFALCPAAALKPRWRHPHLRATLRQLEARLAKARPVDRGPRGQ